MGLFSRKKTPASLPAPTIENVGQRVQLYLTQKNKEHEAAQNLTYFRSQSFDLNNVRTNNEEYWEAVRQNDEKWLVQRVTKYDGLLGEKDAGGRTVETKPFYEGVCFFEALYRIAEYEATQPDLHKLTGITKLERDLGKTHFRDVGHAEGYIFDVRGYPHETENAHAVGEVKFAENELALVPAKRPAAPIVLSQNGFLKQVFAQVEGLAEDKINPLELATLIRIREIVSYNLVKDFRTLKSRISMRIENRWALGSEEIQNINVFLSQRLKVHQKEQDHPMIKALKDFKVLTSSLCIMIYKNGDLDYSKELETLVEDAQASSNISPAQIPAILQAATQLMSKEQVLVQVSNAVVSTENLAKAMTKYVDKALHASATGGEMPQIEIGSKPALQLPAPTVS